MIDALLALGVLVSFALVGGGLWLWRRDRKRALLMLAAGVVLLFNIVMWSTLPVMPTLPVAKG
ncbi:hypothetical protein [Sandaracinobacteroides saxicola]|uniref:Uncharacterized protein n=1 Tax=Sandaracinobacteroides saxicola TaxID=2759707 RepID=A0A7G5IF58_9SPHN|nr:hypothetical protein [Sandaracinobacteroides saxicola]QMW22000.1 hypothetical protein H3309_11525 [Sandaracinobacteroides saxicola]